jgi:tRNA U38,U39,U40 pseudouridine synthase TruA
MANKKIIFLGCACAIALGTIPLDAWHSNEHIASLTKSITIVSVALVFMLIEMRASHVKRHYSYQFPDANFTVLEGELLPPIKEETPVELPKVQRVYEHCEDNDFYEPMDSIYHERGKRHSKENLFRTDEYIS